MFKLLYLYRHLKPTIRKKILNIDTGNHSNEFFTEKWLLGKIHSWSVLIFPFSVSQVAMNKKKI